ncbi:hypothetical protein E2562_028358 [Oryza meyeriana var. granulata]|uniref:Uncharacterized protein n=1 Tax=Oryza meyeriana var. granulata TaxID=110450 RepID=A0A6G1DAG4_9ORYZ|nr:hypothetical protein E2562_028358 [Oryza meyeriana var. granulata]
MWCCLLDVTGGGKSNRRGTAGDDEDEAGIGGEELRASEIVSKEMGLEWMLKSATSDGVKRVNVTLASHVKKANPKELNPYLRDNGSGYPDESSPSNAGNQLLASSVVGDGDASWRLKALKRAKEQAAREGKKLEEKSWASRQLRRHAKENLRVSLVETVAVANTYEMFPLGIM